MIAPGSLRRRAAASAINSFPWVTLTGAVVTATLRRGTKFKVPPFFAPTALAARVVVTSALLAGWGATPGQRIFRLRVVNANTGQYLTFRRALLYSTVVSAGSLVRVVVRLGFPDASRSRQERAAERLTALQPRIRELSDQYADDPDRLSDALGSLYANAGVNPLRAGCFDPQVVLPLLYSLVLYLPLSSPSAAKRFSTGLPAQPLSASPEAHMTAPDAELGRIEPPPVHPADLVHGNLDHVRRETESRVAVAEEAATCDTFPKGLLGPHRLLGAHGSGYSPQNAVRRNGTNRDPECWRGGSRWRGRLPPVAGA